MTEAEIRSFVARMDTAKASEQDAAWEQLRPLGEAVAPIVRKNHHYFIDRTHSGRLFWEVTGAAN